VENAENEFQTATLRAMRMREGLSTTTSIHKARTGRRPTGVCTGYWSAGLDSMKRRANSNRTPTRLTAHPLRCRRCLQRRQGSGIHSNLMLFDKVVMRLHSTKLFDFLIKVVMYCDIPQSCLIR
jgi:hypothetical protein